MTPARSLQTIECRGVCSAAPARVARTAERERGAYAVGWLSRVALGLGVLVLAACGGGGGGGGGSDAGGEGVAACGECHASQAAAWHNPSSHATIFECGFCHAKLAQEPGAGHRSRPACDDCHSEGTHPPRGDDTALSTPGDAASAGEGDDTATESCVRCHEPHGSTNLYLVREEIRLHSGQLAPIALHDLSGRADGGFAELGRADGGQDDREPGSGLCEACHAATRYYNRDGTGEPHETVRCTRCHDHLSEFLVE